MFRLRSLATAALAAGLSLAVPALTNAAVVRNSVVVQFETMQNRSGTRFA